VCACTPVHDNMAAMMKVGAKKLRIDQLKQSVAPREIVGT